VVCCEGCGYAANIEKATSKITSNIQHPTSNIQVEKFATPGVLTIEALTRPPYDVPAGSQIKTLVYLVESKPVLILLRGDHQLNEAKPLGVLGTTQFRARSEEHTSELQSPYDLVCRLLLEKKKQNL